MNPLSIEAVFGSSISLLMAAFWFWVKTLSERLAAADKARAQLREDLHRVQLDYATKKEAEADNRNVMAALERLERKIDRMGDKLDKKADKA